MNTFFAQIYVFISRGYIFKSGIARSCGGSMFNLLKNCQATLQSRRTTFYSHEPVYGVSDISASLPTLVFFVFFNLFSIPYMPVNIKQSGHAF